jgi:hypothetical protein
MFIELDENNEIAASADFKFSDRAIETDREIVFSDGKLYFKDEAPNPIILKKKEMTLERKGQLERLFYSKYPLTKQNNIAIFGTQDQRDEFRRFHDEKVEEFDRFLERLEQCETEEELEKLRVES